MVLSDDWSELVLGIEKMSSRRLQCMTQHSVGSKEPRFESPPRHKLPVLSDVRYEPYARQTPPPSGVMPTMPIRGYIAMSLFSHIFQLMLRNLTQCCGLSLSMKGSLLGRLRRGPVRVWLAVVRSPINWHVVGQERGSRIKI